MLELTNIRLESPLKPFTKNNAKKIRFSHSNCYSDLGNKIVTSKTASAYIDETTIQWNESIMIPQIYGEGIDFQVYNQHQFGYNPEELDTLLCGTITLSENKNIVKALVLSGEGNGKKIGVLVIDVKRSMKTAKKIEKKLEKQVSWTGLQSIIIRNLISSPQKVYLTVTHSSKKFTSSIVQGIKGEFVFKLLQGTDNYLVKLAEPQDMLQVSLHNEDGSVIGSCQYVYKAPGSLTKVDAVNEQGKKVAEMYYQVDQTKVVMQTQKEQKYVPVASEIPNQSSRATLSKLRSMSLGRLSQISDLKFMGTSRTKRISVLHSNRDVVFPSQKRFMSYKDTQTDIISYSKLPSMSYKSNISHKSYKGASLGTGTKSDFTIYYKHNPGVGQYKLPNIFDRY